MAINKVIYGNTTLIDITDTDASATTVQAGKKFYDASGKLVTGVGSALGHETEVLSNGGTAHYINGIDLGNDTVDAAHLASGYTAHDKYGDAIVGTMSGGPLKMGVIRPDAELVKTFSYDKLWVEDDEQTIPAYTTTATTMHTGASLSPTEALALTTYNYYVLIRCITTPIYNTTTKQKGRPDYSMTTGCYEIFEVPGSTVKTISGLLITSRSTVVSSGGAQYRMPYWSSPSAAALYTASSYGIHQTVAAPTVSSATSASPNLTIKDPNLTIRGSTTYLTSAVWDTLTDIRRQYVIEVYRAPKTDSDLNGWNLYTQLKHVINCVNDNFNLT